MNIGKEKSMPNYNVELSAPDIEVEEEIQGERLFSWRNLILGILAGGLDYVDDVNEAINKAYAER